MVEASPAPSWRTLLAPRWIAWHLFAVVAVVGMLWLGDWQFHRAMAGNDLSWAYTFEWPIFSVFGVVFWVKTIRDELHPTPEAQAPEIVLPAGTGSAGSGGAALAAAGTHAAAAGADEPAAAGAGQGQQAPHSAEEPQDAELAEYNAYLAKLNSQVKGHGRWHGLR